MNKSLSFLCIVFSLILQPCLFAEFTFAHRNSTVAVGSSRLLVNKALSNWTGTLEQNGSIIGNTIAFNDGILSRNGTPARATCTYDSDATRQITMSQNQSLRVDHGQFLPKLDVIRTGNRLEGSPIFLDSQSIKLAHHNSALTVAVNSKLNSDIILNNGTIILDDDLHFGDDRNLTGSGTIFFNHKRLSFGGANMAMTGTISLIDANDLILNADLLLSGILTFSGPEAHVIGNGNMIDLTSGGTIWVKAGTKLHLTDITIKGLGFGFFVFEDDNSQIRLSDSEIEMATNYTITQGGIYVNGQTVIVTKNHILTFSQLGTLTVDGVTLLYDPTVYPDATNIQSGNYSKDPDGAHIATINDGRIALSFNDACCRNNSNAIINIINNSGGIPPLVIQNSNAIVTLTDCCINNSQRITNNSNAIISLTDCCVNNSQRITNNSNAIVTLTDCCINNSQRITNNSNAIISLTDCCINNSQRITNNSNAIISLKDCCLSNSQRITNNSNAIIALKKCCEDNKKCCTLPDAPLFIDQLMTCNCIIDPVKQIRISADLTIDGQGAWIMFSNPDGPEFVIDPGVTVRLKDVSLLRIGSNTFQFGEGSKLEIEGIVIFELSEDLFFVEENVEVIGTIDNPSLFIIRGMGSQRNLVFEPIFVDGSILKTWNINFNSLILQNVELIGVESIQATEVPLIGGGTLAGSIALAGEATVDIAQDTDLSFGVEDDNNRLILLENNLTLNKFLLYSPFLDSTLHLKFNLPTLILGNPQVNFADDLLFLTGVDGQARLFFDDYWAIVFNEGINSFDTDVRAFISGRNVEIQNFPIKQNSSDLILDSTLLMHTAPGDLANAIETAFIKSPQRVSHQRKRVTTALTMMREKLQGHATLQARLTYDRLDNAKKQREEVERLERERQEKAQQKPMIKRPFSKKNKKKDQPLKTLETAELEKMDDATLTRAFNFMPSNRLQLRDITLPTDNEITLKVTGPALDANQLAGTVVVSDGSITNFGISQTNDLNLFMLGGATLAQGEQTQTKAAMRAISESLFDPVLASATTLTVSGDQNRVISARDSKVLGTINMSAGSSFTYGFNGKIFEPELIFQPNSTSDKTLTVASKARVEFTGKGTVWNYEEFSIVFPNDAVGDSGQRATLAFSEGVKAKFNRDETKIVVKKPAVSAPFTSGAPKFVIKGIGAVKIDTGAQMLVETGQHVYIVDGSTTGQDIALSIDRLGVLSVDSSAQQINDLIKAPCADGSTISMISGTYSIDLDEAAILNIGCDACYGINWDAVNDAEARGTLTQFTIKNRAVLNIQKSGRLIVGRNADLTVPTPDFGTKFLFDPLGGIITGEGIVALGKSGFAGRVQPTTVRPGYVTAQQFVRLLINTVPALKFATVFIDENGNKKLFNAGVLDDGTVINPANALILPNTPKTFISLLSGDEVCGDDPVSGNVFGFNKGIRFVIKPDGTRV